MKHLLLVALYTSFFTAYSHYSHAGQKPVSIDLAASNESEPLASFTPPAGWMSADRNKAQLPPLVKIMFVGNAKSGFPPSINLTSAPYDGTLKQYLQIVKARNQESQNDWKDLGTMKTQAGNASFSQVDSKSQWGQVRQMHLILPKHGYIYILTAAALKAEFSLYYQEFFKAMQSLKITFNPLDLISSQVQKKLLQAKISELKSNWKIQIEKAVQQTPSFSSLQEIKEKVFNSDSFKNSFWMPFVQNLQTSSADLGIGWQELMQSRVKAELLNSNGEKL